MASRPNSRATRAFAALAAQRARLTAAAARFARLARRVRDVHDAPIRTTSVSNLRAHLSRFLAAVQGGETIVITDRDAPVARLVPVENTSAAGGEGLPSWLLELARHGSMRLGRMQGCHRLTKTLPPGPARGSGVVAALLEDRRSGR